MRKLWDLTSRLFQEESRMGVFLTVNIVSWMGAVLIIGLILGAVMAVPAEAYILNVMCAAIYAGIIIGLFGGIIFIMRNKKL